MLEDITRTIVERLGPRRIILIGSRARGDARPDSDYDVVVEFDGDRESAVEGAHQIYYFLMGRDWSVNVIARVTGEIERSADDPGTIDWDIVREGRVLYSADGRLGFWPSPSTKRVREEAPGVPASVKDWVALARGDCEQATFSLTHGNAWRYVCFFSQQSAEKYLKALLVWHRIRPKRMHSLTDLLSDLSSTGVSLPDIADECRLLSPYVVATRCGAPERYSERTARVALAAAERIAAAVEPLVTAGE